MWVSLKAVPSGAIYVGGCISALHPLSLSVFVVLAHWDLILVELAKVKAVAPFFNVGRRDLQVSRHTGLDSRGWARRIPRSWSPQEAVALYIP